MTGRTLKTALRWLALLPLSYLACFGVLLIAAFAMQSLENRLCPVSDLVSDYCDNEHIQEILEWPTRFFIGLSAIAVVLSAAWLAPQGKTTTAWLALLVGGIFAVQLAGVSKESLAAISFGTLTALAVTVFLRTKRAKDKKAS